MGEVLSQSEIDSLLAALSSGDIDAEEIKESSDKPVKDYDFARPAKFSKEHLRTLEIIFEHYARLLATNLPVYLRMNVQASVINSEAITYSEFSNSLPNPVILGIVNFHPLKGNIMIEVAANLGFTYIDRMLGGQGETLEKTREFSDIELSILEKFVVITTRLMRDPWKNVVELEPMLERIETNPQFAQIIAPNEMISVVTLSIKIGEVEGLMNFCLPFLTLEDIMDKLNTKFWFSTMQNADEVDYHEHIEDMIRHVEMPVKAVLGNTTISLQDFVNLQLGDIIRLDRRVAEELDVYVGNIRKFTALPGAVKKDYAVRITSVVREEE